MVIRVENQLVPAVGDDGKLDGARLTAAIRPYVQGPPPKNEMVLGHPKAPVELVEFGDLQCPVCKGFAEEILPPIIENQVKNGEVKIDFRGNGTVKVEYDN